MGSWKNPPNLQDRVNKNHSKSGLGLSAVLSSIYHVFGSLEDVYSLGYIFLALSFHLVPCIVSVAQRVYTACRLRLERCWFLWQEWQQGCSLMPYAVSNPKFNHSKFWKTLPLFLWWNLKIRTYMSSLFILNRAHLAMPCVSWQLGRTNSDSTPPRSFEDEPTVVSKTSGPGPFLASWHRACLEHLMDSHGSWNGKHLN